MRRTKIVATIGPATSSGEALRQLLTAGTDVVRLNFSHGEPASHVSTATEVRRVAAELGRTVGVLADLQGPKIRIGGFQGTSIILEPGQTFTLDAGTPLDSGTQDRVGLTYPELYKDVSQGDVLLLDDGRLEL
ncbi:MAG: pyruvate kinase, partial [Proteobacteria bacterium]|nr:pyruvate kinase [Pseudomonadota bacterium]